MVYLYRDYQIKPHREVPSSYIIVTDGKGGKIPRDMEGVFTSVGFARQIIDTYLEKRDAKKVDKG